MRGHFITTKKLMMMKKMKYALIVRSFLEQRLTSPAIDIVSTIKKMNTSVITVNGYFRLRVILKKHLKKINNGSQEEPNVPDNSNSGGTINIVYKCPECNEEYVNKWSLTRHKKNVHNKTGMQYNCSFCLPVLTTLKKGMIFLKILVMKCFLMLFLE